jgi:hypothetical protein
MRLNRQANSMCRHLVQAIVIYGVASVLNQSRAADERDVSHALGEIKVKALNEISGMALSQEYPDTFWVKNDGNDRWLFAVTPSGSPAAMVSVSADVVDVEDIAIGPGPEAGRDYLYLGDIGDNDADRRDVRIVRFAEPSLSSGRGQEQRVEDAEVFRLAYPDGSHNAEAMFVDPQDGVLCIVTKEDNRARLYTAPLDQLSVDRTAMLTNAGQPDVRQVSAGAISADGSWVLLRREDQGWLWDRREGESVAKTVARKPKKVPVLGKRQAKNGEAVSFAPDGESYFTVSEGKNQTLYRFDLPSAESDDR